MNLVDIVVKGDEFLEDRLEKAFEKATSKKFDYVSGESITEVY
jgi:starch synthase